LRLGVDGPELRIRLTQEFAATVISEKPQADATVLQFAEGTAGKPGNASAAGRGTAGWIADPPPAPDAKPVRVALGEAPKPEMPRVLSTPSPARPATLEVGDQQAMDKRLDSIRNLLAANLAVIVILLLAVLYQGQQINRNREALTGMHQEAQNAVKTFTPALDLRLKVMEQRMDGFDGKMKQAEDRFVERMNKELPSVMDKYINRKFEELRRQTGK
jgi:hypothetical protein